ncbi:MAG: hypothetical protein EB059_11445 [Alphaproteobacteria bacterium]|nr:hypothetical protein [Alphaproteobacteria bacterium]
MMAAILFAATILERVVELIISRRNAQWSFSRGGVEFGAEHFPLMVAMHSAFLASMLAEFLVFGPEVQSNIRITAMILAVLCQLGRWWIIQTLGYQWNTRVIVVRGMERVRRGPFRFVNHPNYVVVALETVVLPLIFGAWRTAIVFSCLNALMMRTRIKVENEALKALR